MPIQDINPTLIFLVTAVLVVLVGRVGYRTTRNRTADIADGGVELRSTPDYYGWYALVWMFLPLLVITILVAALELTGAIRVPVLWIAAAWIALPALILAPVVRSVHADLNAR
ncbi:MAG: phosphate ABC transporter permease family protein, partial [Thermodesulfobacteriota bacterium]